MSNKVDNTQCYICFHDINNIKLLECKHPYCTKFINTWLKINNTCPACRFEIIKHFKPSNKEELQYAVDEWCINNDEAMNNYKILMNGILV